MYLTEHVTDWQSEDLQVDRKRRLVRNVALAGLESKNGYRYAEQALKSAIGLYHHKPVFLDHAANPTRPQSRSTRDLVGSITNPRFENNRVRADIRILDTDSGRTFLALAESTAPGIGMSHVVLATKNTDGTTVEHIEDVVSVDAVAFPATTSTFHESQTETDEQQTETTQLTEQLEKLTAERDELLARVQTLESDGQPRRLSRQVATLLTESGLPDYAITDSFRTQLEAAPDDPARRALIDERAQLIRTITLYRPQSHERLADSPTTDTTRFIAAIKHP